MQPDPQPAVANPQPPQPLPFEAYNAVIERLVPQDVRLVDLNYSVKAAVHTGPLQALAVMLEPTVTDRVDGADGNHFVTIEHRMTFRIVAPDESVAAEGRAIFNVRLRLGFKPPEEFWPIFLARNVKLYTHPALRDLISSLATRASLFVQPLSSVSVTQVLKKEPAS